MAKINIGKIFDLSKAVGSEAGAQLRDFLTYATDALTQTVTALKNGLNFADNFDCDVKLLSLTSDQAQVVSVRKTPTGIIPVRVMSSLYQLDAFAWWIDDKGRPTVRALFRAPPGTPALNGPQDVHVVILYGRMIDGPLTTTT